MTHRPRARKGTRIIRVEEKKETKVVAGEEVSEEQIKRLEQELEKTREYLSKLDEEKKKGTISDGAYEHLKKDYESTIERLESEIEKIKK